MSVYNMMTARQKRILIVILGLIAVGSATALITTALKSNITYYYTPTKVYNGEAPQNALFRVGGMVVEGSLKRDNVGTGVEFSVTDYTQVVTIRYEGILPDLFKEQQAAVAKGRLRPDGVFIAEEVLAKHDESYMPPEVLESLKKGGQVPNDYDPTKYSQPKYQTVGEDK